MNTIRLHSVPVTRTLRLALMVLAAGACDPAMSPDAGGLDTGPMADAAASDAGPPAPDSAAPDAGPTDDAGADAGSDAGAADDACVEAFGLIAGDWDAEVTAAMGDAAGYVDVGSRYVLRIDTDGRVSILGSAMGDVTLWDPTTYDGLTRTLSCTALGEIRSILHGGSPSLSYGYGVSLDQITNIAAQIPGLLAFRTPMSRVP